MSRPRAADDFGTIRARLIELQRQRAEPAAAEVDAGAKAPKAPGDIEKRSKEGREGSPPPWVPTIFVKQSVGP